MDDLLVHSSKAAHWRLLEQLFKAMCKNGLKLSPKKCQLFKTKLTYMGNEFVIVEKNMTITPLRSRTEALHIACGICESNFSNNFLNGSQFDTWHIWHTSTCFNNHMIV